MPVTPPPMIPIFKALRLRGWRKVGKKGSTPGGKGVKGGSFTAACSVGTIPAPLHFTRLRGQYSARLCQNDPIPAEKEPPDGLHTSSPALSPRRAGAPHRRAHHGDS